MAKKKEVSEILEAAREDNRTVLTEYESKNILSKWGVSVAKTILAKDELEAVDAARDLKYPVVMKISSPDVIDKEEVEGVRVGVSSEIEVRQAFEDLKLNTKSFNRNAEIHGVVVQEYVPEAKEVVIGIIQDPSFGPTVTFGLGGVWIEVLEDMSYRLAPVSEKDAEEMIKEISGYPILSGVRGEPSVDMEGIVNIIKKISELPVEFREISEINLNPVFAFERGKGAKVVDAQITLKK
ncbi:hypothetical protein AKJ39_00170 [candidate division MSBL1 archaeon SCGC-AAA259J03]|uniref:acetate--CoA ligase (ADP-forming) n=2 Tax=candidate division MSBL1 TaxID=215777 RepID=A0A656YXJ8_9EURY|nr:hypothetical protein AKJ61_01140 [candidate division MSBL1 archaeon SCGC-AAA259B11]KXA98953.1 hypothetical protein AKJ39_00170 [candidate division MSBL1 archaeon SCGC-AAA259J03]